MKEEVTLSKKEQKRLVVLNQVEKGKMLGKEAAEILDLSLGRFEVVKGDKTENHKRKI